jgi:hypothetical protein
MSTIVVCPHCAHPYIGDVRIISDRDVTCSRCEWRGPSSRLILVDDDKILDPKVFDKLYFLLHKEIAPAVGSLLILLGIIKYEPSPDNLRYLAEVLRDFSLAGFEAIIRKVLSNKQ